MEDFASRRKSNSEEHFERRQGRPKETVKYVDDETSEDSEDEAAMDDKDDEQIGSVLDFRKGKKGATGECTMDFVVKEHGDPNLMLETLETEDQFLIKWNGVAHYNNTWESRDTLKNRPNNKSLKSLRKVENYINKVTEYNRWKKSANPEDVECQDLKVELERNLLKSHLEPERIFAEEINSETGETVFYVKWKNLPYSESTWENSKVMKSHYLSQLERYLTTKESTPNPIDYKQIVKIIQKGWQPMKQQADFIDSETLKLRDHQMDGINFLLQSWHKGNSVILADEMGLGKTIQAIVFLKYLFHNYAFKGPTLVCVPLSTLAAWQKEFEIWAPEMDAVAYVGDNKSREIIRQYECEDQCTGQLRFTVLLTTYETAIKDRDFILSISWSNIVIDEAHRLKNQNSVLYKLLLDTDSHHRLLITGTPLQNSLKELWCLLNFIQVPDLDPWEQFENNYGSKEDRELGYAKLHKILKNFIIRRLKKDVEKGLPGKVERILRVEMTVAQKRMYKNVLTKNFDVLRKGKNQVSLLNLMMQLRKTCNHSHLILDPDEIAQDKAERSKQLIDGSGKLLLLDKMLTRFRENGDRVLIFSQMVTMLNIIEEYLLLKRYQFQRLDGSVSSDERKQSIARFNDPESTDFCFLLSTKAGGLGINLQTANVVIIFDSDFNPQNDLQAIARAHRIGQKEEVKIYRLVASNSVDEEIIRRARKKIVLDHLVIQRMDTTGQSFIGGGSSESCNAGGIEVSKDDLNMILKFGAEELFKSEEEREGEIDIDAILKQAEVMEEIDDEAHSLKDTKELFGSFKCTTLTFDSTGKEIAAGETPLDWDVIIPLEMRSEHLEQTSEIELLDRKVRRERLKKSSLNNTHFNPSNESSQDKSSRSDANELETEGNEKALACLQPEGRLACLYCDKSYTRRDRLIFHCKSAHSNQPLPTPILVLPAPPKTKLADEPFNLTQSMESVSAPEGEGEPNECREDEYFVHNSDTVSSLQKHRQARELLAGEDHGWGSQEVLLGTPHKHQSGANGRMGNSLCKGVVEPLIAIQQKENNVENELKENEDSNASHISSPVFHGFPSSPQTSLQRNSDQLEQICLSLNVSEDGDVIIMENEEAPLSNTITTTKLEVPVKLCEYPKDQKGAVIVSLRDYATLESSTFVNDIIIDFYIKYLELNVLPAADQNSVQVFSTMFYKRLMQSPKEVPKNMIELFTDSKLTVAEERHNRVANWTKNIDLFSKKIVIVPICLTSHWFLLVVINPGCINFPDKSERTQDGCRKIIVLDSMGYNQETVVNNFRAYLKMEWKKRSLVRSDLQVQELQFSSKEMPVVYPTKPEQLNGVDCGVFLLHYVEKIFQDVSKFLESNLDLSNWFRMQEVGQKRAQMAELLRNLDLKQNGPRKISYPDIKFS